MATNNTFDEKSSSDRPPVQPSQQTTASGEYFSKDDYQVIKDFFPWQNIGGYSTNDPAELNKDAKHKKSDEEEREDQEQQETFAQQSAAMQNFVIDKFYSDLYWNTAIMIGTCFFSWLMGKIGAGIFALGFVYLSATSVYRAEFRRFNRNLKDDMTRVAAAARLEDTAETMDWLNSFLAKFWVIYMPALSDMVMTQANAVLGDAAPGFGIDDLSLDQFTLGTKAPTIDSIKSYTKKGKDIVEMDWAFSFAPNVTDNMSKNELKKKVDPKVALGVRVGKGFVSKNLPILVEDMQFIGRMRIAMKLSDTFPHIKTVSVSFLEPPNIEYGLKPIGGDTLGLDIMTMIPGLSSFVNSLIHSNLGPMLYAPNSLDIDVEEIMAAQSNDAIGVAAVTLISAECNNRIDPYIEMNASNAADQKYRSNIKKNTKTPKWNETQYVLIKDLSAQLELNLWDFNEHRANKLIGSTSFDLNELLQNEVHNDIDATFKLSGKDKGHLRYSIKWFPIQEGEEMDDGTKSAPPESEVGILKFTIQQAKGLDVSKSKVGELSPYCEVYIDNKLERKSRVLKRSNEPAWGEDIETLITTKSNTKVKILVRDSSSFSSDPVIGKYEGDLQSIIYQIVDGNDVFKLSPQGGLKLAAQWRPLALTGVSTAINYVPAYGALRVHIRRAQDLKNLEAVGAVDPYVRIMLNGRMRYQTLTHPDTTDPNFEETVYLPISTEHSHVAFEVMDAEQRGKDRPLGSHTVDLSKIVTKTEKGYWVPYDGAREVIVGDLALPKKKPKGTVEYSISFVPTIPVYSPTELEELEEEHRKYPHMLEEEKKEQARLEKIYKKNPKNWEWYDEDEEEERKGPEKRILPLEELVKYQSGVLALHFEKAKVAKTDSFIQVVFDELSQPAYTSARAKGSVINNPDTEDAFIRDLYNSEMVLRATKKDKVKQESDVITEKSFKVIDLLYQAYNKFVPLEFGGNTVNLKLEYIPSAVELPESETMSDVGKVHLQIIDGFDLRSADSGGKSDPFAVIRVNDQKVYKTNKKKRTLDPVWHEQCEFPVFSRARSQVYVEVYDWDVAGKNDLLGKGLIGLNNLKPGEETEFKVNLDQQGAVHFIAKFTPEYIRPKISKFQDESVVGDIAGAPMKLAGAGIGAIGAVGGGVTRAPKTVVKGIFGGKKKRREMEYDLPSLNSARGSMDVGNSSFDGDTTRASGTSSINNTNVTTNSNTRQSGEFIEEGFVKRNQEDDLLPPPIVGVGVHSPYSSEVQSMRSGRAPSKSPSKTDVGGGSAGGPVTIGALGLAGEGANAQGKLSSSSSASSVQSATDIYPGRVTVLSLAGVVSKSPLQVKVTINKDTTDETEPQGGNIKKDKKHKDKEIYKTKNFKSKEGYINYNESVAFKASPSYAMTFHIVEHHVFGSHVDVASATVNLQDALGRAEEMTLPLEVVNSVPTAGETNLSVSFNFNETH